VGRLPKTAPGQVVERLAGADIAITNKVPLPPLLRPRYPS
jgi:hypothetical protein